MCVCVCVCVCVVWVIGHATHTRHVAIRALPRSTIFPSHYLTNGAIFGEKSRNTKCVFWFSVQLLSETFLILRRTERDMIKNVYRSSCTVPVIVVVRFSVNCSFLDIISKNSQISNLMKISTVRAGLFCADGQTWRCYWSQS